MKNWKTTVSGIIAIVIALAGAAQALISGGAVDWTAVISAIIAGVGLISAKDNNVTGGTVNR